MSPEPELSDAEALRRSRRDPDAICVLYDRYLPRLLAVLVRAGGNREVAFDLAQETFARTLERGYRVKVPPGGSAWPWLFAVARNLLRDWQRRQLIDAAALRRLGIHSAAYDPHVVDELIARVDTNELAEALGEALDDLPLEQRQAVVGKVALDLGYDTLAQRSGASEQAVRARVSRGLRALRFRLSGGRP
jgi:RNA polymerase sigma factor (sigma-70 family)